MLLLLPSLVPVARNQLEDQVAVNKYFVNGTGRMCMELVPCACMHMELVVCTCMCMELVVCACMCNCASAYACNWSYVHAHVHKHGIGRMQFLTSMWFMTVMIVPSERCHRDWIQCTFVDFLPWSQIKWKSACCQLQMMSISKSILLLKVRVLKDQLDVLTRRLGVPLASGSSRTAEDLWLVPIVIREENITAIMSSRIYEALGHTQSPIYYNGSILTESNSVSDPGWHSKQVYI